MKNLLSVTRNTLFVFLSLCLFCTPVFSTVLVVQQTDGVEFVTDDFEETTEEKFAALLPIHKADQPGDFMILPFFEVDTQRADGKTTLYALRNVREQPIEVDIHYADLHGEVMLRQTLELPARQTLSVNLRDVEGLKVDEEGFSRGMVMFLTQSFSDSKSMVGDFFQIDTEQHHATGDRLISLYELCDMSETRFLDFSDGTHLRILISQPRGLDLTRPTFTVTPIREDGTTLGTSTVYTDQVMLEFDAEVFTKEAFGTLVFDFSNGRGGYVYSEHRADGRFSVGLNSACREFEKLP